ncbi:MAG: cysteine--tRNA ligase [Bacteroidota bacterium]
MPDFVLHDSLSREAKPLVPAETTEDGTPRLTFYGCGPTVYSYAHIGNFRSFLTADLIVRTAEALGWHVDYVSNVTDVGHLTEDDAADAAGEDRMAKALKSKEGERFANVWDLARHYTEALVEDWHTLGLREPTVRPRAAEHVREQIRAVQTLIEKGHAYETEQGVYFSVASFPDYGKLSGNTEADALDVGAAAESRDVVTDDGKRDPRDFALWKKDEHHLMQWHSPFTEGTAWGFPGWHLECSVMAQKYLGDTIDLHAGGEDLRFPHHECEIAQAECLTGETFARHWVHTRFLQVNGAKMSKRTGSFLTVRDLTTDPADGGRDDYGAPADPLALRLALIAGHYRKPLNFTRKALTDAAKMRRRYQEVDAAVQDAFDFHTEKQYEERGPNHLAEPLAKAYADTLAALCDDLNTPTALAAAYRGVNIIASMGKRKDARSKSGLDSLAMATSAKDYLDQINALLGIVRPEMVAEEGEDDPLAEQIETLLAERVAARKAKDYARADAIRDEIEALGVEVMDSTQGTTWRRRID